MMEIGWTLVHSIEAPFMMRFASNARNASTSRAFQINKGHSPTRRKTWRFAHIKGRGAVSDCVTAPIILLEPTNPWALHLPTPLPRGAPHGRPRGLLPRVRATCASHGPCVALPRGLNATSHPRWSPRATSSFVPCHQRGLWNKKTPFFAILIRKINKN